MSGMSLDDARFAPQAASPVDETGAAPASARALYDALGAAALGTWEKRVSETGFRLRGQILARLGLDGPERLISRDWWRERIHPEDRRQFEAVQAAATTRIGPGEPMVYAYRVRMHDGEHRWLEGHGAALDPAATGIERAGVMHDVTDRKRLEADLVSSEARLEAAMAASRQGAWRLDMTTGEVAFSRAARDVLGLGETQSLSLAQWRERLHPEDRVLCERAVAAMMRGEPINEVYRVSGGSDGWRWIEDRGSISRRGHGGEALEASGTMTDITERRAIEEKLAQRDVMMREAFDAGLAGIFVNEHDAGVQRLIGQAAEWIGRDGGEAVLREQDWRDVIHPDDIGRMGAEFGKLAQGRPAGPVDYRLKAPGGWRWVRSVGAVTRREEDGRAARSSGVVVDVTAEKALAAALEAERERLAIIYRATPVMMHSLDAQGRFAEVSAHWLARTGHARDAVIGKPASGFYRSAEGRRDRGLDAFLAAGPANAVNADLIRADGAAIKVQVFAVTETDPDGSVRRAHGASVDVTRALAQERALTEQAERLERSNRELDRFAAVASHDLQEPLRKISAFTGILKRRLADAGRADPESDRIADYLVDASARLRRLIDDLLTYSRAASRGLERRAVDMKALTRNAAVDLEWAVRESGARIEIGELPVVEGDPVLLAHLMSNLLSNAIKYRRGPDPRITVTAEREGEDWRFAVVDDGIGVDPRFAEKIFAPFQRLHDRDAYEGSGIGLAICQQAVERHGGRIWVKSASGQGSAFHFTLPAQD